MHDNSHMIPLSVIDKDKYPILYRYWSAMRKDPSQPMLKPWLRVNRDKLQDEVREWGKVFYGKDNLQNRLNLWEQMRGSAKTSARSTPNSTL